MPIIPSINLPNRIDERVQETSLRVGASPVTTALGAVGGEVANIGLELLQKRKQAEASAYANQSYRSKKIESERKRTELFNDMNPLTGRLSSGRSFFEEMEEWEINRSQELEAEAPTDLALQTFKNIEVPAVTGRLADVDSLQHKTMLNANIEEDRIASDEDAKIALTLDETTGASVYETVNDQIEAAELRIASKRGIFYDDTTLSKSNNMYNNHRATNGVDSMLSQGNIRDAVKSTGLTRLSPDREQNIAALNKALTSEGVLAPGQEATVTEEGGVFAVLPEGKFKNLATGEIVNEIPKIEPDVIGIPVGEERPNQIYKYLKSDDINKYMGQIARKLKESGDDTKREITQQVDNLSTALISQTSNRLRLNTPGVDKHYAGLINRIENTDIKILPQLDKDNLVTQLISSKVLGEFKDSSLLQNPVTSARVLNNIPNMVKSAMGALGKGSKYANDPAFNTRATEQIISAASSHLSDIRTKINKNMPEYLSGVDTEFIRKDAVKFANAKSFDSYVAHVEKRLNSMGVPPHNQKFFSPDSMASDASDLNRSIQAGASDGYRSALQWVISRKAVMGDKYAKYVEELGAYDVPGEMLYIAMFPNNTSGNATAQRAIENMVSSKDRATLIPTEKQNEIRGKVFNEIAPELAGIANKYPDNLKSKFINAFVKVATDDAYRIMIDGGKSASNAAEVASENMVKRNYTTVHRGSSIITMSFMEQQMYGLNEDLIKAADKYYTSKEFIVNNLDLERTIPQLTPILDVKTPKGASKLERNKKAYELLTGGLDNLSGEFTLEVPNDRLYPGYIMKSTGTRLGLYGMDGEIFSSPLKGIKNNKEILKQTLNPFSEFFLHHESSIFKGK